MAQSNDFAIELFRRISHGVEKSVIISPLSLSCSLAMAMLGAKNQTAKEIRDCIAKAANSVQEVHEYHFNLLSSIELDKEINVVNKAFLSKTLTVIPSYGAEMSKYYNSEFDCVDFIKDKEEVVKEINKFVAHATNQKIQQIVCSEMFNAETAMVIINAVYFEKKWLFPFSLLPSQANHLNFYSKPGIMEEIPFLTTSNDFHYVRTTEFKMVELYYQDEKFSMIVILPHAKYGLASILENINIAQTFCLIKGAKKIEGTVIIPRFKTESAFNHLPDIFKKMGIIYAFDGSKADFSNISQQQLHISSFIHKTFIEVDEEGTTATAATEYEMEYICDDGREYFQILADHPFLYFIVDTAKNIIFIGTFYNN